jgi:rubrerythrin
MKKEKAAFKLYNDLAGAVENVKVRTLFLALAQEEAKHKLHFEIEYDDMLTDN